MQAHSRCVSGGGGGKGLHVGPAGTNAHGDRQWYCQLH